MILKIVTWSLIVTGFFTFCYLITAIFSSILRKSESVDGEIRYSEDSAILLFTKLDSDSDGQLSLQEFLIYEKYYKTTSLADLNLQESSHIVESDLNLPIDSEGQVVTVKAFFKPLNLSSLSKNVQNLPREHWGSLRGLFEWTQPFARSRNFSSSSFSSFLPPLDVATRLEPGATWWVVEPKAADNSEGGIPKSGDKFFPSPVGAKVRPISALLSMFHSNAFLWTRFSPQGALACLRSVGETHLEVVFRIHAEFQLNDPPRFPFWFTPAQFRGRLVISRNRSIVHYFRLEVPTVRSLNVDMEWLNGPTEDSMEVDIGYIPQMILTSSNETLEENELAKLAELSNLPNTKEISIEEAFSKIERMFYPFKQVHYHGDLPAAFGAACSQAKLVHGVLLWGSLDDQSC